MSGTVTKDDVKSAAADEAQPGAGSDKPAAAGGKKSTSSRRSSAPKRRGAKPATPAGRTTVQSPSGKKNPRKRRSRDSIDTGKSAVTAVVRPGQSAAADAVGVPVEETAPIAVAADDNVQEQQPEDPKSLSWMAAQAVSALNAVKASQAEKLQAMLAAQEKAQQSGTEPPGSEGTRTPEAQVEPGEPAGAEQTATAEQLAAARATAAGRRLPLRPMLWFGVIAVVGLLGYVYWFGGKESIGVPSAPLPEAAVIEPSSEQSPADMPVPQHPAITVVTDEPLVNPVAQTTSDAAGNTPAATPQPESPPSLPTPAVAEHPPAVQTAPVATAPTTVQASPAEESPAATRNAPTQESSPLVTTPTPPETGAIARTQLPGKRSAADSVARQEAEQRAMETTAAPSREPEAETPAGSATAVTGATTPPPSQPVTRPTQPRYRSNGYGYYPQPPSWQQRYPNSGYPQYPPH